MFASQNDQSGSICNQGSLFNTAAMDKFLVKTTPSKLSSVPADLESLDKPALIATIKRLRRERDELAAAKTSPPAKKSKPSPPRPSVDIAAIMKRLREKSIKAIKKTPHTEKRKPYTEVTEGCASKSIALALLGAKTPKSDTKRMTRWVLEGDEVPAWLGCERLVHPVNFDGYSYCLKGETPRVYFWAAFESLEVKY